MGYHIDYPYATMDNDKDGVIKNVSTKNPINIQTLLFVTNIDESNGYSLVPGTQSLKSDIKKQKIYMNESETKIVFKLKMV